jgi:hypothetical protein
MNYSLEGNLSFLGMKELAFHLAIVCVQEY